MGCEGSVMEDPDNEYDSTWDDEYEEQQFGMMRVMFIHLFEIFGHV